MVCYIFVQVKDFLHRFASIPDMLELDHLTVSGDVTFGKNVTLKVCIENHIEWFLQETNYSTCIYINGKKTPSIYHLHYTGILKSV